MKRSVILPGVLVVVACLFAAGRTCTGQLMAGYVRDATTLQPIANAQVTLQSMTGGQYIWISHAYTTGSGYYAFDANTPGGLGGIQSVTVRALNHERQDPLFSLPSSWPGPYPWDFLLKPVNGTPIVEAGPDVVTVTLSLPCSVKLAGSAKDPDSWPQESKPRWTYLPFGAIGPSGIGPGNVTFDNPEDPATIVNFDEIGTYVLMLEYNDGASVISDEVVLEISGVQIGFKDWPQADAGPDTVTVADWVLCPVQLAGSAGDPSKLQVPPQTMWSVVSGPGPVEFSDPTDPKTLVTFTASGRYVLQLICDYGEYTSVDTVTVEVGTVDRVTCEALAHWDFEEGSGTIAHDLSGHGYDGTLRGNPQWAAGQDGGALKFDGKDDYVDTAFTQNLSKWTICGWVSSPASPSDGAPSGPIHREQNFQINWNHGDPKFRSAAALSVGGTWYAASFGTLAANTWYHLAATYDGVSLKAYCNGQLVTTTSCAGTPAPDNNSLKLGRHAAEAHFFAGTIDHVYVYPCALNQDEIEALMNPGIMSILEVVDNGIVDDEQMCHTSLDLKTGTRIEYPSPVLDLWDNGPRGHFGGDQPFGVIQQGRKTAGNVDHLSLRAEGVIHISAAQAGNWTFGVNSDDGFTLLFPGRSFQSVTNGELFAMPQGKAIRFFGGRALADTFGVINLPAGDHPFWLTYHEGVLEAAVEFFAAQGTHTAFDPDLFRLVGQKDIGKLAIPGFCDEVSMLTTKPGANGSIDSLAKARAALAASERTIRAVKCLFVNHVDPETVGQGAGTFGGDVPFPNDGVGKDDNEFAVKVTGLLDIPADGVYQIGFNSDDGASLKITGETWQSVVANGTGKAVLAGDELIADVVSGNTFTAGRIALTKGCHTFEAIMFEHDGGSYFELFGRGVSDKGIPDPTWRLLRTAGAQFPVAVTGLQLVNP